MEEKIARRLVQKYLEKRSVRFKAKKEREAGPDILIDGVALETKGSDLNEKETPKQLTRYASEYAGLAFAFPLNRLTLNLLYSLYYLEAATAHIDVLKPRSIRILLLAEKETSYFAKEYDSVESLLKDMESKLAVKARLPYDTKPEQIVSLASPDILNIEEAVQRAIGHEMESHPTSYKIELE